MVYSGILRIGLLSSLVSVGCGSHGHSSEASDSYCDDAGCCDGPCCGDQGYCDESYDTSWQECFSDEECPAGSVCQDGFCTQLPTDALPPCEDFPAFAELVYGAGVQTRPMALGVLRANGDAMDDLAIVRGGGQVDLWLSAGDGQFSEEGPFATNAGQGRDIEIADLNGDSYMDFAVVSDNQPGTLGRLFGDDLGGFVTQPVVQAGPHPTELALADFNLDGALDVALLNTEIPDVNVINILLADGQDDFLVPADVTLMRPPTDFAVADLDGNDVVDIAVANNEGIAILLGRGTGGFDWTNQLTAGVADTGAWVAVTHLDGAGGLDFVRAANVVGQGQVALWTAGIAGEDTNPTTVYTTLTLFTDLIAADIEGNGKLDAILGTQDSTITLLMGGGDGTFTCAAAYPVAKPPVSLVTGDFDGDGRLDIAGASGEDSISVLVSGG